ncbi:dihydrolipoamide succinyltransferase [Pyrenochaeta sp. DS3sAY3a]|nr:dihydrolipoamide succinyltransferase [Pyrenochaeta sp. DS3sAY3a]
MRGAYWRRGRALSTLSLTLQRVTPASNLRRRLHFNPTLCHFSTSTFLLERINVVVPPMAESISEGTLASFNKKLGDYVEADEEVASIETDKIDIAVNAPVPGRLIEIFIEQGEVVHEGQEIASVETSDDRAFEHAQTKTSKKGQAVESKREGALSRKATSSVEQTGEDEPNDAPLPTIRDSKEHRINLMESPQKIIERLSVETGQIINARNPRRIERTEKLSRMRQTIAKRLKDSQNRTASLTTVQRVDMSAIMAWRQRYKNEILEKHDVKLGYMGIFTKTTALAAQIVPEINASIDTDRSIITFRDYVDISIAVSTPRGLVTPVVRNCEMMSVIEIEKQIGLLAKKARDSKLTFEDLDGGNFSISNPGIFGSFFGTPLINYPQSAVFNMNGIREEPVVIDGKIEIRPMMFITLTYDHRLIDGLEAVTFLNTVKEFIEDPTKILLA